MLSHGWWRLLRLKEMLRTKLVQCGWRDEMKAYCRDIIRQKGVDKVNVEELVEEITPKGRCTSLCFATLVLCY